MQSPSLDFKSIFVYDDLESTKILLGLKIWFSPRFNSMDGVDVDGWFVPVMKWALVLRRNAFSTSLFIIKGSDLSTWNKVVKNWVDFIRWSAECSNEWNVIYSFVFLGDILDITNQLFVPVSWSFKLTFSSNFFKTSLFWSRKALMCFL